MKFHPLESVANKHVLIGGGNNHNNDEDDDVDEDRVSMIMMIDPILALYILNRNEESDDAAFMTLSIVSRRVRHENVSCALWPVSVMQDV